MSETLMTARPIPADRPSTPERPRARSLPPAGSAEYRDGPRFSVLGPLTAWHGDAEADLGQPQQRALLAALLMQEGSYIATGRLVEAIWGDGVPATAEGTIRTYVYRLRRALTPPGSGPGAVIASVTRGYVLRLPSAALDLGAFRRSLELARTARESGDRATEVRHLREGLGLWRDTMPLGGVPGEYAERYRTHLNDLRLSALATRLAAELALGRLDPAVAELSGLVAEHPLDERFRVLFMTGLHQSGRRAEALSTYHEARAVLRDRLGIDPGRHLRRAYAEVLGDDPAPR
jgi:DNA-binding SARP family transcriptional activator